MSDAVTIEADGAVRILTMNWPDSLNAFNDELHAGLPAALARGRTRPRRPGHCADRRRTGVQRGRRSRTSPGWLPTWRRAERPTLRTGRRLFEDLIGVHLPVIAAVNGPAVGLGCTIATACDFVLVSDKAFLADPHVQVALVAGDGGAITWPLSVGLLRAKQYLMTGDRINPGWPSSSGWPHASCRPTR